jgi:hypothetical protein
VGVQWEYQKLLLNEHNRRGDDIELLCAAGKDGWELVSITLHSVAYLKRVIAREPGEKLLRSQVTVDYRRPRHARRGPVGGA